MTYTDQHPGQQFPFQAPTQTVHPQQGGWAQQPNTEHFQHAQYAQTQQGAWTQQAPAPTQSFPFGQDPAGQFAQGPFTGGEPMALPSEQRFATKPGTSNQVRIAVIGAAVLVVAAVVGGYLLLRPSHTPVPAANHGPVPAVSVTPSLSTPAPQVTTPAVSSPSVSTPAPQVSTPANPQVSTPGGLQPTLPASQPTTPDAPATQPRVTQPVVVQPSDPTGVAWPAAYSPFSDLIGESSGAGGFGDATCSLVTDVSQLPSAIDAVACTTPTGPSFTVVQFQSADSVQAIISKANSDGSTVRTWSSDNQVAGESIEQSSSTGSELVTTFSDKPTMIVDMNSTGTIADLETFWTQAPLPA